METTKACRICQLEKPLSDFRKQSASKDGHKAYCKPCDDEYNKKNYRGKADKRINQIKSWQENHPNNVKAHQKKYRDKKSDRKV